MNAIFINDVYEPYWDLNIKNADYRCIIIRISKEKWGQKLNAKCRFDWKTWNIIKHKSIASYIKMCKEILTFGDIEIEKKVFHKKLPFFKRCRYWESISI